MLGVYRKAKSVLSPPGRNVLCLKIILASKRRLFWVSRKPERITDTSISVLACPGDAKCRPTGRSVLLCRVERECSLIYYGKPIVAIFNNLIHIQFSIYIVEDITCPRVDMNFIFEWSTRYLTSERSERVRYRVDHEKIKFISISGHVMFCLLYKHQWNTKPFYFNTFNGLKVERVVTKHGRSTWTKTKFIW